MRIRYLLLILCVLTFFSCDETWIEKPKGLVKEDQMVDILIDLHISNSLYENGQYENGQYLNYSSSDFYYSVLQKHQVVDSVFEKSFIYYSSYPEKLEEIYSKVLDKVNQMNTELLESINQPLDLGTTE